MFCEICHKTYKNTRVLAWHISKCHKKVSPMDYTIKYRYNNSIPKCKCGCNNDAPYRFFGRFMTYVSGHNSIHDNGFKGKTHSKESIQKMLNSAGYKNKKMKGKFQPKASKETKTKMRISHMKNVIINNGDFFSGKNEKSILRNQEKIDSCKIITPYPIQELGYVVDGYDMENNRVYEVYEKFHDKNIFKDLKRENEICNYLNCDFVILYDRTH